jgi:hypothetical protein
MRGGYIVDRKPILPDEQRRKRGNIPISGSLSVGLGLSGARSCRFPEERKINTTADKKGSDCVCNLNFSVQTVHEE